ncbi:MAG: hypothetical protein J5517_04090, partial [Eubacterium sp.]|nr:hypothetical protein [Eubacterium sp.]
KEVTKVYVNKTDKILHLTIEKEGDIETIDTTEGHPFYVEGKGWVRAGTLQEGDILTSETGTAVVVSKQTESLSVPKIIYNLEVADNHTYFVSEEKVLVHNSGNSGCSVETSADSEGGSGSENISTPNSGQGFSPNGYNPQPGERTLDGYVKNHASPEISLHTDSAGFNNNNGNVGGDFKRFGAESHGGVSPHVHQPQRNVAPNGNIYGTVGTKTANGGVTLPSRKDVKQLYEYLTNGKYH